MPEAAQTLGAHSDDPDLSLLRAVAAGDSSALQVLYERHGRGLLAYLVGKVGERMLAEELLQDVMLAVWQGARGFRGESRVRTWLLSIAHRRASTALRRRRPATVDADGKPLEDRAALEDFGRSDQGADMRAALRQLSSDQQEALELVFYHGLTGAEAARVMDVREGTVKSRLHRAKAALRGILNGESDAQT